MSEPTPQYADPIGDKLAELAALGEVYNKFAVAGKPPVATRCAMLRLVGEIYVLASMATVGPKPAPTKYADA